MLAPDAPGRGPITDLRLRLRLCLRDAGYDPLACEGKVPPMQEWGEEYPYQHRGDHLMSASNSGPQVTDPSGQRPSVGRRRRR